VRNDIAMSGQGFTLISFLICLIYFIDFLKKGTLKFYAISFFFFILSTLSSEHALVLIPLISFLWVSYRKKIELRGIVKVYLPFVLWALLFLFFSGMRYPTGLVANNWGGSYFGLWSIVRAFDYVTLIVYPFRQSEFVKLTLLNIVAILTCVSFFRFKGLKLFFAFWIIVSLVPYSFTNFREIENMFRYLYLPILGFTLLTSKSIVELITEKKVTFLSLYSIIFWVVNIGMVAGFWGRSL